jgi:hypothetical protein
MEILPPSMVFSLPSVITQIVVKLVMIRYRVIQKMRSDRQRIISRNPEIIPLEREN